MIDLEQILTDAFVWFHEHPELSYEEYETTKKIREILGRADVEILPLLLDTGLVAVIRGGLPGETQALRCDMDALPIQEESGLPYASKEAGRMHACGHDLHITAGLGCALLLQERKKQLKGTVKIIFQPGEESSLGALKILETGAMEDVDRIWGIHSDPTNEAGVLGIREGYAAAAVDRFLITVKGEGCHGAHPDDGWDPIPAASAMVQAFQTIITRNINAFHPALVSVTRFQAGNTWNVVPDSAVLEGTVRTMDKEDRKRFERRMREIAEHTANAYGVQADLQWIPGCPAVYNDAEMAEQAAKAAKQAGYQVVLGERSMGGDDFSFYQTGKYEGVPGCYLKIGTGKGPAIHQPGFAVDRSVIQPAVYYLTELLSK